MLLILMMLALILMLTLMFDVNRRAGGAPRPVRAFAPDQQPDRGRRGPGHRRSVRLFLTRLPLVILTSFVMQCS